jgi:hypothetical protein
MSSSRSPDFTAGLLAERIVAKEVLSAKRPGRTDPNADC